MIKYESFHLSQHKYDLNFLELAKNCKVYLKNNTNTVDEFTNYLKQQMVKIIRPFRPDWDVYFMKVKVLYNNIYRLLIQLSREVIV